MSRVYSMSKEEREKTIEEIKWYYDQMEMPYEDKEFDELSDKELNDKLFAWEEFNPCPEI